MKLNLEAVGLLGPGLPDWQHGLGALAEPASWQWQDVVLPPPKGLPAAERRRVSQSVKLAMAVAHEALERGERDPVSLASVFSSSGGDGQNCHILCEALADDDPQLSPTRFTNSVHNAPSGYWSIATGCHAYSTSISGFDESFAAGLTEAALLAITDECPVLLVAYDVPYPFPLSELRPISTPFAVAMMLAAGNQTPAMAQLELQIPGAMQNHAGYGSTSDQQTTMSDPGLEALRTGVPAARCLPLLSAIAQRTSGPVYLPMPGNELLAVQLSHSS